MLRSTTGAPFAVGFSAQFGGARGLWAPAPDTGQQLQQQLTPLLLTEVGVAVAPVPAGGRTGVFGFAVRVQKRGGGPVL